LRRLDGVDHVALDTVEQRALITFGEPVRIDFARLVAAADSAAFPTAAIRLEAGGEITTRPCSDCEEDRAFLRLEGTGQELELRGAGIAAGGDLKLSAAVRGWDDGHVWLEQGGEEER